MTISNLDQALERVTLRIGTRSQQAQHLADSLLRLRAPAPPSDGAGSCPPPPPVVHRRDIEAASARPAPQEITPSEPGGGAAVPDQRGPFDDLLDLVARPSGRSTRPERPLPPPSRFMVRVASVPRPHRATKRDYDYFEELSASLAAKARESRPSDAG